MDYDDMKRKYLPKKNISLSFGVVFECPETFKMKNINKLIGDIYDALGEKGSVVYHRVYNEIVIIIRNDQPINFFAILKAIDRHVINIKLPLILYQKRDVIESLIEEICDDNCMAKLIVDTDVLICIAGKLKEVLNARKKILYCIEKLMNKEPMVYKGYISGDLMLRNKVRMFFVSKINDQEVILSGRKDIDYDVKTCLRPRNNLIEQAMYFDSTKLIYAFFYLRDNIEDILVENDCYIGYELTSVTTTKLCIKSFQMLNLKKCIRRLKVLFQDIIKMTYTNESILCTHKMFTFESSTDVDKRDSKRYLSIGLRSEVKKMVENSVNNYEIEIDIDYDLEDFLCGKKNGKINKICRDNDCDVVLCTKIEEGCKMMVLYISGCGTNLYKTLLSLENEYPAELGFHLQERHHRRIIGYGGKNIQRIMKKHGVYIKFMSEEERVLSGYDGNVIIKTPKRNETSLSKMKEEVLEMADEPCEDKDIEKRELDLYTYYEYFFEGALMLWNRILILKLLPPNIMIYLLSEISSNDIYNNEYVRIIEIPGCPEQFVYSFINLDLEVITSEKWIDKKPSLSFKLFDSVLLYAYEPMFKLDLKKSKGEIDFSDKIKEYDDDDIFAVGNRKKAGGGQTK